MKRPVIAAFLAAAAAVTTLLAATGQRAQGLIVAVPGSELVDGETLTLDDGVSEEPVVFEFDDDGSVEPSHTPIPFTIAASAAQVAAAIATAIVGSPLQMNVGGRAGFGISVINEVPGVAGNTRIDETVAASEFLVIGMFGGTDDDPMPPAPAPAEGIIFPVPGSSIDDGATLTMADGADAGAPPVVFEFDADGTVTSGRVRIAFTDTTSLADMRDTIVQAVNASTLQISATRLGYAILLINDAIGAAGNKPLMETVGGEFAVAGMSGGVDSAPTDNEAPISAPVVTGTTGNNGWYTSAVAVAWNWTDAGSGVDPANCVQSSSSSTEGTAIVLSAHCFDLAGNIASDSRTVKIDMTPPTVTVTGVVDGASYAPGAVPVAGCSTTDTHAGVAAAATVTVVPTGASGFTATCAGARDSAGNAAAPVSAHYTVSGYSFTGFVAPVDNPPVVNAVKAGQAIKVKFSLGGDFGLGILAAGYPKAQEIPCGASSLLDTIDETVQAGSSTLTYDAATGVYSYIWKTDKAWARTCRQLTIRLTDGSDHVAYFSFK